jgi:DNA replication protein DnaC
MRQNGSQAIGKYKILRTTFITEACQWLKQHLNILITGPTGVGKHCIACALVQKDCREGYGSSNKLFTQLSKADVLIVDDLGLAMLTPKQRRQYLEMQEDRHGSSSTIITSQLHGIL